MVLFIEESDTIDLNAEWLPIQGSYKERADASSALLPISKVFRVSMATFKWKDEKYQWVAHSFRPTLSGINFP